MAGTLVSWAIIVIIWGCANTQFLFLCALTQTDGCLATSQELIIDPFAKSSFLCWFFHLPPSEYKAIRLDVGDPGDTPDVRWLAVVIMGGAVVTMVRRLHIAHVSPPPSRSWLRCARLHRDSDLCVHIVAPSTSTSTSTTTLLLAAPIVRSCLHIIHRLPEPGPSRGGIWQINFKTCIYNFSPLKDGSFVM